MPRTDKSETVVSTLLTYVFLSVERGTGVEFIILMRLIFTCSHSYTRKSH